MERQYAAVTQLELICPICNKAFESAKQTSRHVRYCRSKAKDGQHTRRKSCFACIKAKTRCRLSSSSSCTRCAEKSLQCLFEAPDASSTNSSLVHQKTPSSTNAWPGLQLNGGTEDVNGAAIPEGAMEFIPSDPISWDILPDTILPQIHNFKDRVVLGSFYVTSLAPYSVPLDRKNILEKRNLRLGYHGSTLGYAYCMSTLRTYPEILYRNDGMLPPFIHPQAWPTPPEIEFTGDDISKPVIAKPLAICRSIMQMYKAKSSDNSDFIWRTIQSESRRIGDEYLNYDVWTTLAAIQAMTIYIILGLLDNDNEYVVDEDILIPMLNATKRLADRLQPTGWMCYEVIQQDEVPAREIWALTESRRRTAVVLVLLMHMFNIEHEQGLPQCGGFVQLPLPCSNTLWQAPDQKTWEMEYRKEYMRCDGSNQSQQRIPTYRDLLLDLQDQNSPASSPRARYQYLSEWFSNMDQFGTLVTFAVSTL